MLKIVVSAFQILAVTPVTTCTCERSISALRRLKTYLRSTMGQVINVIIKYSYRDLLLHTRVVTLFRN